jgi:class 3 adenylate cyclase
LEWVASPAAAGLWSPKLALRLSALLSVCAVAGWAEERLYAMMLSLRPALRFLGAVCVPGTALSFAALSALGLGPLLAGSGRGGTLALALLAFWVWMASAALGSLIVVGLDLLVSSLVSDLRSRITLMTLGLLLMVSAIAFLLLRSVPDWASGILSRGSGEGFWAGAEWRALWEDADAQQALSGAMFALLAAVALPAVLSASGKLAEAMMDRLHPLLRGFEAVAKGQFNVRVEVAGSWDFMALSQGFNDMVSSLGEARLLERAFGRYVGSHVLNRIRRQHGEDKFSAQLRSATVFFADIRGFTAMSERLPPATVMRVLNRYFEQAVPLVEKYEGYLNKFVGDAMVVVFNGPIEQRDHPERAVQCAIALQQQLEELNEAGAFPEVGSLHLGIGVATGPLVAGSLGSAHKLEYTVVGDTVNLASRLTRHAAPGEVWCNEVNALALPKDIGYERLSPLKLKGKEQPVVPCRVWPPPEERAAEAGAEEAVDSEPAHERGETA